MSPRAASWACMWPSEHLLCNVGKERPSLPLSYAPLSLHLIFTVLLSTALYCPVLLACCPAVDFPEFITFYQTYVEPTTATTSPVSPDSVGQAK